MTCIYGPAVTDWDPREISHGIDKLQTSQASGELGTHSGSPKHRTSNARIRLATPAQLSVVDKLLELKEMELPDAAYEGAKLADDPRYGKPCGSAQLANTLAVYDRADAAAARLIIVAGLDFEGTSPSCSNRKIWYTRCQVQS